MLGDNPTLLPTVFVCPHDYATVVIMFYSLCLNKVPSKSFGIVWMIVDLILCKNRNFCAHSRRFENSLERAFDLNFFTQDWYTNFLGCPNFSEFLELQKYRKFPDYHRLFYFWQILFSLCCLLILMNLWVVSEGMNHEEVGI